MNTHVPFRRFLAALLLLLPLLATAAPTSPAAVKAEVDRYMGKWLADGRIPGLSAVLVTADGAVQYASYGYRDDQRRLAVNPDTIFELASCSKAFTGLAVLRLVQEGKIDLDDPVSRYLPGFHLTWEKKPVEVLVRHLLHQTSGLPWKSIARLPADSSPQALQSLARSLSGLEITRLPGVRFEYATLNYDLLGAIIETVSGKSYEQYMEESVFAPLGLPNTRVGRAAQPENLSGGFRIGFGKPRLYNPPVFRGNFPAGYITSNARDLGRWLQWQLGILQDPLWSPLILKSQQRDETVPPDPADTSSYAAGWKVALTGSGQLFHKGDNPNFSSHFVFSPARRMGVAVVANSNSDMTVFIANSLMNIARGKGPFKEPPRGANVDKTCTVITYVLGFYLLVTLFYLVWLGVDLIAGRRSFAGFRPRVIGKLAVILLMFTPYVLGVYFIPQAVAEMPWSTALVWSPSSFAVMVGMLLACMALGYLALALAVLFPHNNHYVKSLPLLIILSLLAGGANAVVIFLVNASLFSPIHIFYQVYNFLLAFLIYIFGRKMLQTRLIQLSFDIVYDLRMKLLEKIFYTSYQRLERLDRGRIFATLNDDTGQIGGAANLLVALITSVITAVGAFLYLASIAFWATMLTLGVVAVIAVVYSVVSQRTRVFFEEARDTRNVYMRQLNGMIDGFQELSMQFHKRQEYRNEIAATVDEFRRKIRFALIKFVNAFLIGESLLIIVLGAVGFAIPRLFPDVKVMTLMSFIMVLLYLIGPVNGILRTIPDLVQIRVAWNRVRDFIKEIPANISPEEIRAIDRTKRERIETFSAHGLRFEYPSVDNREAFAVGPLDFSARSGEIVFVIGGNGSGKTTLAKLLAGLYVPTSGTIEIDGVAKNNYELGEYFSVVLSNHHLFEKLYNIDLSGREEEIRSLLRMLRLQDKVTIENNAFSTLELSGGQRKRLALLRCYLENNPIYLFDEVAADQDPEFRRFFYRTLLPRMKEAGKVIIAITHDDHYFDVADRVIKLDMGRIEVVESGEKFRREAVPQAVGIVTG